MAKYLVKNQSLIITENKTFPPEKYGGWSLVNIGDVPLSVNGIILDPAGAVIGVDYTTLPPNVTWSDNISIRFLSSGGNPRAILTRLEYSEIEEKEKDKKQLKIK